MCNAAAMGVPVSSRYLLLEASIYNQMKEAELRFFHPLYRHKRKNPLENINIPFTDNNTGYGKYLQRLIDCGL